MILGMLLQAMKLCFLTQKRYFSRWIPPKKSPEVRFVKSLFTHFFDMTTMVTEIEVYLLPAGLHNVALVMWQAHAQHAPRFAKIWCRWWITEWCIMRDVGWWMMNSKYRAMLSAGVRYVSKSWRMSKQNILAASPESGDFSHRKLRYYVPEHMVTASAYFYICIFVVPSLGRQQHWTPVGGAMLTAQKQGSSFYAIGDKFNLRAPPALSFFLGKGVIRQWWISAAE